MTNPSPYKFNEIVKMYCMGKNPTLSSKEFEFWEDERIIVIEVEKSISDNHLMSKRKVFYNYDVEGKNQLDIFKLRGNIFSIFCGLKGRNEFYSLGMGYLEKHPHKPTEIKLYTKIRDEIWKNIGWTVEELRELRFNGFALPDELNEIIIEDKFYQFEYTKGQHQFFPVGFSEIDYLTNDFYRLYDNPELKLVFGLDSSKVKGVEIPKNLLDVDNMICIGDADYEAYVCLDFREANENPPIIALVWGEEKWERVAANVEEFEQNINLKGLKYFMKN